jgi:hypothetical protein
VHDVRAAVIKAEMSRRDDRQSCNSKSGTRDRDLKQQLRLGIEREFNKNLGLEVAKRAVEFSIEL